MEIAANPATAETLSRELFWLGQVIDQAVQRQFHAPDDPYVLLPPPTLASDTSDYADAIRTHGFAPEHRLILILAMAPHLMPHALDPFLARNPNLERCFTMFGGIVSGHGCFRPTHETAAFLLSGGDLHRRFMAGALLAGDGQLVQRNFIDLSTDQHPTSFAQPLLINTNRLSLFTRGEKYRPDFHPDFPAKRLTTALQWTDLILPRQTLNDVEEILAWIEYGDSILADPGFGRFIRPGFRSLFHGPPGTGKTLTATLLGQVSRLDVYRVDLSMIVSKWIGETEKNLASVFDQAEGNGWILFFDEADALFGKRTDVSHSNDRYANQEVSYILQRVEDFDGIVILASNLKGNIDDAFSRRFQSMIHFPMPGARERLRLWQNAFPDPGRLAPDVDLNTLANDYELSGGAIVNILRYAVLSALRKETRAVTLSDIKDGISRELRKDGRIAEVD